MAPSYTAPSASLQLVNLESLRQIPFPPIQFWIKSGKDRLAKHYQSWNLWQAATLSRSLCYHLPCAKTQQKLSPSLWLPPAVFPGSSHYGSTPQMLCKVCQTLESGDVVMTSGRPLLSERLGSGGAPDKLKLRWQGSTEVLRQRWHRVLRNMEETRWEEERSGGTSGGGVPWDELGRRRRSARDLEF